MNMTRICLLPLGLLLFALTSAAQSLEFRVISWQGSIEGVHYVSGGQPVRLIAHEQTLSARHRVSGMEALELFREVVVDGQPRQAQVASIPLPQGMRRAILVLAPGPGGRLQGAWLNDNRAETGRGNFVFHNLATYPVALRVGDTTQVVRPQNRWVQPFARDARAAQVMAAVMDGDTPRHILNSSMRVHPEYRIIAIFRNGRPLAPNMAADAPVEFVLIYDQDQAVADEETARTSDQVVR